MSDFVQQLFDTLHIDVAEETSSIVIVGMETMKQLKQNLKVAESFTPMSDEKRLAFFKDIIHLVEPAKVFWKATDWDNPTEWIPRNRGKA